MPLPLCYCTNVHPCRSAAEVEHVLDDYAVPVRERAGFGIAVGLWLPAVAVDEMQRDAGQRAGRAIRRVRRRCGHGTGGARERGRAGGAQKFLGRPSLRRARMFFWISEEPPPMVSMTVYR